MKPLKGDCIPWTGTLMPNGYGRTARSVYAHRLAYENAFGPIPEGLEIDHICHSYDSTCRGGDTCPHRRCVNPDHLEAVTHAENGRRGVKHQLRKTHCPAGHPYNSTNTFMSQGRRRCYICARRRGRKKREAA